MFIPSILLRFCALFVQRCSLASIVDFQGPGPPVCEFVGGCCTDAGKVVHASLKAWFFTECMHTCDSVKCECWWYIYKRLLFFLSSTCFVF